MTQRAAVGALLDQQPALGTPAQKNRSSAWTIGRVDRVGGR